MASLGLEEMSLGGQVDGATQDVSRSDDDVVDPWKVESKSAKGVDYDKLIRKYIDAMAMSLPVGRNRFSTS